MIAQDDQPEGRPLLAIPYSLALTDETGQLEVAPAYEGAHWGVRCNLISQERTLEGDKHKMSHMYHEKVDVI